MKPMLAGKAVADKINFPVLASPKIDGVRAIIHSGEVLSRSLKPIRNPYVQEVFGRSEFQGLDGELVVGSPTDPNCMQNTTSGVMRGSGEPDFQFHVFDIWDNPGVFEDRFAILKSMCECYPAPNRVRIVEHHRLYTHEELDEYEAKCLAEGYEGVMIRDPAGKYKYGRSTTNEGGLLKIKRFEDSEAIVIGVEELMHNANEAKRNELGRTERSTSKDGLVPMGALGALHVRDVESDIEFRIGTGFTAAQRDEFWADDIVGRLVTYKHFANGGVKEAPRFPVFKAFRDMADQ